MEVKSAAPPWRGEGCWNMQHRPPEAAANNGRPSTESWPEDPPCRRAEPLWKTTLTVGVRPLERQYLSSLCLFGRCLRRKCWRDQTACHCPSSPSYLEPHFPVPCQPARSHRRGRGTTSLCQLEVLACSPSLYTTGIVSTIRGLALF